MSIKVIYKNRAPNRVTTEALPKLLKAKREFAPLETTVAAVRGELVDGETAWMPPTGRTVVVTTDVDCWGLAANSVVRIIGSTNRNARTHTERSQQGD
jgi:hypothetical protein